MIEEILEERVVSSRGKHLPRGVKRRILNKYPTRKRGTKATRAVIHIQLLK